MCSVTSDEKKRVITLSDEEYALLLHAAREWGVTPEEAFRRLIREAVAQGQQPS